MLAGEAVSQQGPEGHPPCLPSARRTGRLRRSGVRRRTRWPGHRRWERAPGAWASAVSSSWFWLGPPAAKANRRAKKFGNFSSGGWRVRPRGCRIRRGQVRRGAPGAARRGAGRPSAGPALTPGWGARADSAAAAVDAGVAALRVWLAREADWKVGELRNCACGRAEPGAPASRSPPLRLGEGAERRQRAGRTEAEFPT